MKRYLVLAVSWDSRPWILANQLIENQQVVNGLVQQYGAWDIDTKVANFLELGREPWSVVSFHNKFLRQCRDAFVAGNYYPALTGACALGERILNHLVLKLRTHYKNTASYKKVYSKESFDHWNTAIDVLEEWQVFIDEEVFKDWQAFVVSKTRQSKDETDLHISSGVADLFRTLNKIRNRSIHFRIDLDGETREPALRAIQLLQDIVAAQFGAEGPLPWFIPGAPGAHFIKKEFEDTPVVREFYLPACAYVGPNYQITSEANALRVSDPGSYEDKEISDQEFVALLNTSKNKQREF